MSRDFSTRSRRRAPRGIDRLLLAGAAVLLLAAAYWAGKAWADLRAVRTTLERTRLEAQTAARRVRTLESRRPGEGALTSRILLTREAPPSRVLADLTALMPGGVRLSDLALGYGDRLELALQVRAREAAAYDLFLKRLAESPRFRDVFPGEESREGEVRASVHATYRVEGLP